MRALPAVARRVSSNPDAYVYLAESIRAWPDQAGLAALIAAGRLDGDVALAQPHRRHRRPAPRRALSGSGRVAAPAVGFRHAAPAGCER